MLKTPKCIECNNVLTEGIPVKNPPGKYICPGCFAMLNPKRQRVWCAAGSHYVSRRKSTAVRSLSGSPVYVCSQHWTQLAPRLGLANPQGLYEAFHGAEPKSREVNVATPDPKKHLVAIGKATAIEYQTYGSSTLKDGKKGRIFRHEFGDTGSKMLKGKPILATQGKHLFFAEEPKALHFSSRGIIA